MDPRSTTTAPEGPHGRLLAWLLHEETGEPSYAPESMRWVAVLTTLAAAAPLLLTVAAEPSRIAQPRIALWLVCLAAFLGLFWVPASQCQRLGRAVGWLLVHTLLALALFYLLPNGLFGVFLVVVAARMGDVLPLRAAFLWVAVQTVATFPGFLSFEGWAETLMFAGAFGGFQLFAAFAARVATRERNARQDLARVNAELVATRELLAETSRGAERLRIARDLHDVVGHHLTALSLHLEAARHAPPERARQEVGTAQGMTRRLLAEVRRVVSRLRDDGGAGDDLEAALDRVAGDIHRPRVHLRVADGARRPGADAAAVLVRCAQEVVTNAIRHSGAENLWIEVEREDGGVAMSARDDGRGAGAAEAPRAFAGEATGPSASSLAAGVSGYGLEGMRERLEQRGGRLSVHTAPGEGFEVRAWVPATP